MNIYLPNATPQERLRALQSSEGKVEKTTYYKPLTEDELNEKREVIADNCIKLSDLSEEKKEAMKGFKDTMEPLQLENAKILSEIRTKMVEKEGTVYHIADFDNKMMETYDENGILVSSRRLKPNEMQKTIFDGSHLQVANG